MADKHPYTSGISGVTQAVTHLRKSFPAVVTADTFKKLGIAPNNETYLINILRFLGIIDQDGRKTPEAGKVLIQHEEEAFQSGFAALVESAYHDLFELYGPEAWTLSADKLISFFRSSDNTTDIVGRRQANTFLALAALSGKIDGITPRTVSNKAKASANGESPRTKAASQPRVVAASREQPKGDKTDSGSATKSEMALTVRVEINLPAGGTKETYDNIFKSIKENLLNGKVS